MIMIESSSKLLWGSTSSARPVKFLMFLSEERWSFLTSCQTKDGMIVSTFRGKLKRC